LPNKLIFLIKINDPTDPKADTFGRVVALTDFAEYDDDRALAVTRQDSYYRVDSWVFYYTDLTTAVNATDVLKTRIDELTINWELYTSQFETVAETIEHPRTGLDTFNALVAGYDAANTAEATALTARTTAKDTYDMAMTNAAAAATAVSTAETLYNDCITVKGYFDACLIALSNLYTQANTLGGTGTGAGLFLTDSNTFKTAADVLKAAATTTPPSAEQKSTYDNAAMTYAGQLTTMGTTLATFRGDVLIADTARAAAVINQSLFAMFCTTRQTELTNARTAKTTADTAVANARTAYESAQAGYESAQRATEAALAAIRALKPTWTPTDALVGSSVS
jgi:hypothetical protein